MIAVPEGNGMGIQERKHKWREELRRKILSAARELFVTEGYEKVSMRKIARKIEYSPTTIYHHFRDKAELLDCVCRESQLGLLRTVEGLASTQSEPVELLRQYAFAYARFGLEHPEDYKLMVILRPQYQKGLGIEKGSVIEKLMDHLNAAVSACVQQKHFLPVDEATTGQAVWAAVHGVVSLLIGYPDFPWTDRDQLVAHVIDTMLEGLRR
jgi:AcrR family transcriptional regulator